MTGTAKAKRVLVVDDEPEVTFALQVYFLGKGYEMLTALDGTSAMNLIRQNTVDLVILDMKMPGVNGIEVIKFIRSSSPETKVVVVTAYDVQFQEMIEQLGVDGFLTKPFGIESLTHTVEEALAGRKTHGHALARDPVPSVDGLVPKAKLLFVEPSEYTYKLKELYFRDKEKCGGCFQVSVAYSPEEVLTLLKEFSPDIILVDLSLLGTSGDLTAKVMHSSDKPKEMIIHGSKSVFSGNPDKNMQQFSRLGVKMVQNESFTRAGLARLGEVIRTTAVCHGLLEE